MLYFLLRFMWSCYFIQDNSSQYNLVKEEDEAPCIFKEIDKNKVS